MLRSSESGVHFKALLKLQTSRRTTKGRRPDLIKLEGSNLIKLDQSVFEKVRIRNMPEGESRFGQTVRNRHLFLLRFEILMLSGG